MTILANPPLIEVVFEIKWGEAKDAGKSKSRIQLPADELSSLPQKLQESLAKRGFSKLELMNQELAKLPHFVAYRYRQEKDTWPCFQLGNGIFTVNQLNDGYEWNAYVESIRLGLEALNDAYNGGFDAVPLHSLELRYQDGLFLSDGETTKDFLTKNINIVYSPPEDLITAENIQGDSITRRLSFTVKTTKPSGILMNTITNAHIGNKPGLVMDTRMLSFRDSVKTVSIDSLCEWLNGAHNLQKEAFKTLIRPAYLDSLK